MQRIIMHWTGGSHHPNGLDLAHYHYVIAGDGALHLGKHPVRANQPPLMPGGYAAHTRNGNAGSIGVALAGMAGARERPFTPGPSPITLRQLNALARLCHDLALRYEIAITPEQVLTHAEVETNLGIRQAGKWDIRWLPGMAQPDLARVVGDQLRARIRAAAPPVPQPARVPWYQRLWPRQHALALAWSPL